MNSETEIAAMEEGAPTPDEVKRALRRLASSVAIITTRWQGRPLAMAATAVSGLSLEPPSLLVCVNRTAAIFAAMQGRAPFCVNILARDHEDLAQRCGGGVAGAERFRTGAWRDGVQGVPYLEDAQASLACAADADLLYGTHGVFIGRILEVRLHGQVAPLIHSDARYCGVA
jgi:flavin reductase (DIM6/NTAB) family NADH-FMN oxidoreductase RutF